MSHNETQRTAKAAKYFCRDNFMKNRRIYFAASILLLSFAFQNCSFTDKENLSGQKSKKRILFMELQARAH
tara:strand:+ start:6199 stop:6411 length:213 start_codon:yes stop_codon:yes gene_type:complete